MGLTSTLKPFCYNLGKSLSKEYYLLLSLQHSTRIYKSRKFYLTLNLLTLLCSNMTEN